MNAPALSATTDDGQQQAPPIPQWPGHRFLELHDRPDKTTIVAETIHGGHRIATKHTLDRTLTDRAKHNPVSDTKDRLLEALEQFINTAATPERTETQ